MMTSVMLSYALHFSFSFENFTNWSKQINKHIGTLIFTVEERSNTLWLEIIAKTWLPEEITIRYNLNTEKEAPI